MGFYLNKIIVLQLCNLLKRKKMKIVFVMFLLATLRSSNAVRKCVYGTNTTCTPFYYDVTTYGFGKSFFEDPKVELQEDCRKMRWTNTEFCLTEGQRGSWAKGDWEYCGDCVEDEEEFVEESNSGDGNVDDDEEETSDE